MTPPDIAATLRAAGCVFAEEEARLLLAEEQTADQLADMVRQRVSGLPLEHVLGWAEFCGLRIEVDRGVFVPRRRTELLVHEAARLGTDAASAAAVAPSERRIVVLDMCCGSGAVGVALSATLHAGRFGVELHAVDVEPAAVRCAGRNLASAGGRVYEGDLYAALPPALRGTVDVLVANAPYVPTDSIALMPAEARLFEPRVALDGGADGLDVQRRIIAEAPRWLARGGHLLVETSRAQAPYTVDAFTHSGLTSRVVTSDELGATVVIGAAPR